MLEIEFLNDDDFMRRVMSDASGTVKPVLVVSGEALPDNDTRVLTVALKAIFGVHEVFGLIFTKNIKLIAKLEALISKDEKFTPPSLAILKNGKISYYLMALDSDMTVVIRDLAALKTMKASHLPASISPTRPTCRIAPNQFPNKKRNSGKVAVSTAIGVLMLIGYLASRGETGTPVNQVLPVTYESGCYRLIHRKWLQLRGMPWTSRCRSLPKKVRRRY